jgi:hypothetical protein
VVRGESSNPPSAVAVEIERSPEGARETPPGSSVALQEGASRVAAAARTGSVSATRGCQSS